jgi:hypothetical protein
MKLIWSNIPRDIQEKMLEEQYLQKGYKRPSEFIKSSSHGFVWVRSTQGHTFWADIIYRGNIEVFYNRYPLIIQNVKLNNRLIKY